MNQQDQITHLRNKMQELPVGSTDRNIAHVVLALLEKDNDRALDVMKIWLPEYFISLGLGIELSWFEKEEQP